MKLLKIIKKIFPKTLKRDIKDHLGVPSLSWSLKNLRRTGYRPGVVYDIGAYEGYWTKDFLEVFPLLIFTCLKHKQRKRLF